MSEHPRESKAGAFAAARLRSTRELHTAQDPRTIEHPAFFTTSTLARHVQLSERTIRDLLRSGEIPSYKLGGARRIAASDVDAWLAQHRQNGAK